MKSLIITILVFIQHAIYSQNATVQLALIPAEVCKGDSIEVSFTFTPPSPPNTSSLEKFTMTSTSETVTLFNDNYNAFYSFAKKLSGPDTIYSFKSLVTVSAGLGTVQVQSSKQFTLVKDCYSGLNTYAPENAEPIYYDLYGNQTSKQPNMILIMREGNTTRKIFIQE